MQGCAYAALHLSDQEHIAMYADSALRFAGISKFANSEAPPAGLDGHLDVYASLAAPVFYCIFTTWIEATTPLFVKKLELTNCIFFQ